MELGLIVSAASSALAQQARQSDLTLIEKADRLRPGQYVWELKGDVSGPISLVIDLCAQRALLYRNDVPIAASTVSTGGLGRETPPGASRSCRRRLCTDRVPMTMRRCRTCSGSPGRASRCILVTCPDTQRHTVASAFLAALPSCSMASQSLAGGYDYRWTASGRSRFVFASCAYRTDAAALRSN
jgi:hypothetical protein